MAPELVELPRPADGRGTRHLTAFLIPLEGGADHAEGADQRHGLVDHGPAVGPVDREAGSAVPVEPDQVEVMGADQGREATFSGRLEVLSGTLAHDAIDQAVADSELADAFDLRPPVGFDIGCVEPLGSGVEGGGEEEFFSSLRVKASLP